MDGKEINLEDAEVGENYPPMHPNCRSVVSPVDGRVDRSKATRSARNPVTGKTVKVPANMTYQEWYKQFVDGNKRSAACSNGDNSIKYIKDMKYDVLLDDKPKCVNDGLSYACKNVAESGYKDDNEHLILVNLNNGKLEYTENGNSNSVGGSYFWNFLRNNENNSYAFVHNHNDDSSFSIQDIQTLSTNNSVKMFVISRYNGTIDIVESNGKLLNTINYLSLYENQLKELNIQLKSGIIDQGEYVLSKKNIIISNLVSDYTKGVKYFGK